MRYIGYARVSSKDQNLDRQIKQLEEVGCEVIFTDKMSGKDTERPQFQEMVSGLEEGDCVVVTSLDRLSRSYSDTEEVWALITKELHAHIKVLDLDLLDTTRNHNDLTGQFIADLVLKIVSYVAEKERIAIKERQAQGIAIARDKGRYKGRRVSMDGKAFLKQYQRVESGSISVMALCRELGITKPTFYNLKKRYIGE